MGLCRLGADAAGVVRHVSEPRLHSLVERLQGRCGDDDRRGDKRRAGLGHLSIDSSWLQYNAQVLAATNLGVVGGPALVQTAKTFTLAGNIGANADLFHRVFHRFCVNRRSLSGDLTSKAACFGVTWEI